MAIPASVYILTCNSSRYLRRVLDSVSEFDDIVVVDSGSQDNTLDIAHEFNCRIYSNEWPGFAKQKTYAKSLCRHSWVLDLDSDEEIDTDLLHDINDFMVNDKDRYCGLEVRIHDRFLSHQKPGLVKTNSRIKFYHAGYGYYDTDRLVHETVQLEGPSRMAKGYIIHHGIDSIAVRVDKSNRYAALRAQEKFDKGKRSSLIKLIGVMPAAFIKAYILKRSFLAGRTGFINSVTVAYYAFLKEAKLYELEIQSRQSKE